MSLRSASLGIMMALLSGLGIWLIIQAVDGDPASPPLLPGESVTQHEPSTSEWIAGTDAASDRIETSPFDPEERVVPRHGQSPESAVLVGRFLDGEQRPLANRRFEIKTRSYRQGTERRRGTSLASDEEGRWRLPVGQSGVFVGNLIVHLISDPGDRCACVAVGGPLPGGKTDVGDMVLRPPVVLAAGTVTDSGGRTISEARVSVDYRFQAKRGRVQWVYSLRSVHRSDETGAFEIRGPPHAGMIRVRARKSGFTTGRSAPVPSGSTGVEVVLRANGSLAGSVRLPEGVAESQVEVLIRSSPRGPPLTTRPQRSRDDSGLHPFSSPGLAPGTYDVEFRLAARAARNRSALVSVRNVVVPAGEVARDPRLQGLDLRGNFLLVHLHVVDEERNPIRFARASIQHQGERSAAWGGDADSDGRITIPVTDSGVHVRVDASGYLSRDLGLVTGDCEVILSPGYPIQLSLRTSEPLPPGLRMVVTMRALEGSNRMRGRRYGGGITLDSNGQARLHASVPGRHRLGLRARLTVRRGLTHNVGIALENPEIVVKDTMSLQPFVLETDAKSLARSLAKLRER